MKTAIKNIERTDDILHYDDVEELERKFFSYRQDFEVVLQGYSYRTWEEFQNPLLTILECVQSHRGMTDKSTVEYKNMALRHGNSYDPESAMKELIRYMEAYMYLE